MEVVVELGVPGASEGVTGSDGGGGRLIKVGGGAVMMAVAGSLLESLSAEIWGMGNWCGVVQVVIVALGTQLSALGSSRSSDVEARRGPLS